MVVNSMTDVTVPETLVLSVLGMVVVFIVLVFLMLIIYITTTVINRAPKKAAAVEVETSAAPVPTPLTEMATVDHEVAAPAVPAPKAATPASTLDFSGVRKFKVVVDGTEYEVDAEMGDETVHID